MEEGFTKVFTGLFVSDVALNIAKEVAKYIGNDGFSDAMMIIMKKSIYSLQALKQFEKYLLLAKAQNRVNAQRAKCGLALCKQRLLSTMMITMRLKITIVYLLFM